MVLGVFLHTHTHTHTTYSLGLVLTSTLRGPLLVKQCLRKASISGKGLRNTRSPFIQNTFLPTSRPAIYTERRNKAYDTTTMDTHTHTHTPSHRHYPCGFTEHLFTSLSTGIKNTVKGTKRASQAPVH